MSLSKDVKSWTIDDVSAFLDEIGLPHLKDAFRTNAVNGSDLIELTPEDFTSSLGCTPLQYKKIHKQLEAHGVSTTQAAASPVPQPAAPLQQQPPPAVPAPVATPAAAAAPSSRADQLQTEIQQLQTRVSECQRGAQAYATGQQHLRRAEAGLKQAAGSLSVTQASGAVNMVNGIRRPGRGRGPLGRRNDFAHNVIDVTTIQRANGHVKQAAQDIQLAKQILPNLPFIQPAQVQQAMTGVFINLFARGIVGDMMQQAKVRQAKQEVTQMHQTVVQALDWCVNNMNAAQTEAATLNGQLTAKQAELAASN